MRKHEAITQGWFDAWWFLREYGVKTRDDIRPEAWAYDLGIEIVEADLDGASAQLIRLGDLVQIVLSERITESGARRFAIAHEIYHFLKKHPSLAATMLCKPKWVRSGAKEPCAYEIGSNAFGSAVLLPDFLLRKRCEVSPVSLDVPWQITKEYDVSILASARRFVELSSERCAAVFAKDGVVQWSTRSATFTRKIRDGRRLHRDSIAWDFHATGKLDERDQPVPARAWFGTTSNEDIIEHATCRPDYGTVLSLLWVPDAVGARVGMP
ncbi:MAG: ImmA/IrrE family metallo-endopeptidase [Proteobacteria bacterium]|nr:ImmA/IrrE family metallo-endopeptidase [Pseudomonadota bacterium]